MRSGKTFHSTMDRWPLKWNLIHLQRFYIFLPAANDDVSCVLLIRQCPHMLKVNFTIDIIEKGNITTDYECSVKIRSAFNHIMIDVFAFYRSVLRDKTGFILSIEHSVHIFIFFTLMSLNIINIHFIVCLTNIARQWKASATNVRWILLSVSIWGILIPIYLL